MNSRVFARLAQAAVKRSGDLGCSTARAQVVCIFLAMHAATQTPCLVDLADGVVHHVMETLRG